MATAADVASLRLLVNEPADDPNSYTSTALEAIILATPNLDAAAALVWAQKAARYAELVNVKEGNSSRDLGDLYDQALSMSKHFKGLAEASSTGSRNSRTRPIDRV